MKQLIPINTQTIYIISWFIFFQLLGLSGFINLRFILGSKLDNLKDKGYTLGKVFAVCFLAYIQWLAGSLHLIPFNNIIAIYILFIIYILLTLAALIYLIKKKKVKLTKKLVKDWLLIDFFMVIIYLIYTFFRGFDASILGTEKLMDIAFINSFQRTKFFPPENPWLSGFPLNYYYWGQYLVSYISRIITIPTRISYNLMISTIPALTFALIYNLLHTITKKKFWGFLGGFIAILAGNIDFFLFIVRDIYQKYLTHSPIDFTFVDYWFPSATRLTEGIINEFPSYSHALGDLHGHFLDLPVYVSLVVLLYLLWRWYVRKCYTLRTSLIKRLKTGFPLLLLFSFFLALTYMTNSWDTITILFTLGLLNISAIFYVIPGKTFKSKLKAFAKYYIWPLLANLSIIAMVSLILVLPFLINFNPPISGLGFVKTRSTFEFLLIMWGGFLIPSILFLLSISLLFKPIKRFILKNLSAIFVLILGLTLLLMIIGLEFFYIPDIFSTVNSKYARANTIFKFYYALWIYGSIMFVYLFHLLHRFFKTTSKKLHPLKKYTKSLLLFLFILATLAMSLYWPKSIHDMFNEFFHQFKINTDNTFIQNFELALKKYNLDGYAYIKKDHPEDYAALEYLNNLKLDENLRLVEPIKNKSYSYYGRISAYTGIPGVIGWPFHPVQWQGDYDAEVKNLRGEKVISTPYDRVDDIEKIYTGTEKEALELIQKYQVDLVYWGELGQEYYVTEKELTPNLNTFEKNCRLIYKFGDSRIYNCQSIVDSNTND